ncbi:MAG: UDP-N-acetylmuramoyl-L-alanine--D-glutamate ligase [Balneolaceae bacterium]
MNNIKDRQIVVLGAARSGAAAATLLKKRGADVWVSDSSPLSTSVKELFVEQGIRFEENGHSERSLQGECLVVSPGVPDRSPVVQSYLSAGKSIYSELEAASWFNSSPIVAVTGSNGKTTVTSWLAYTWSVAGREAIIAGNIGNAFSSCVEGTGPERTAILEVSSFQLDHIDSFRPAISILLNITPDHLDRYEGSFKAYKKSKLRITENQKSSDTFIYNYEDPHLSSHADVVAGRDEPPTILAFSDRREVPEGAFVRDNHIIFKLNQTEESLMHINDLALPGRHNLNNGLATALAARASEIKSETIRESLKTFEGVEHRLETVRVYKGVKYVNDSKATNINAVWYALDSFHVPIVLILGGRDKGNDYTELEKQLVEKVHTVVAIGEAKPLIKQQIGRLVPNYLEADTLKEAVQLSAGKAKRGEIVLLSPACSSFDMFDNYEHRGELFKQAVLEL